MSLILKKPKPEIKNGYSLELKIALKVFCGKNLEYHADCTEKLSDSYSRFQNFTENQFAIGRRYFKAILIKYLKENYSLNITDQATNVGVIISGIGLVPEYFNFEEN